jgi:hypothetical protein
MSVKKNLTILVAIILVNSAEAVYSQKLNIGVGSGLGSYNMSDLKLVNQENLISLPFNAKVTDNFPMYWNYNASLLYSFRKWVGVGINGSFQSTGSRTSRTDYSGEYFFDARIHSVSPGIIIEIFYPAGKPEFYFRNEAGIEFTKLTLSQFIKVGTFTQTDSYSFSADNFYYYPSLAVTYPLLFLRIGLSAGYLIDIKREALTNSTQGSILINSGTKTADADWSGFRIGVSVTYNLFQLQRHSREAGR